MAIDDVNAAGGIKSLGGAKMKLMEFDAGDSAEKAKDAAQRMVAQEPDLAGGFGGWLSSFTLAATEVTERAELPWLTLSYSDLITGRGFKYVFQSSPTADAQAEDTVPIVMDLATKATGKRPTKVAIVGDNTAASVSFLKPMRDHVFKNQSSRSVADEIFTPPLADATTIVQKLRSGQAGLRVAAVDQCRRRQAAGREIRRIRIDREEDAAGRRWRALVRARIDQADRAGESGRPDRRARELAGQDRRRDIDRRFIERTKEPWFGHDSIFAYAHVMILKEAIERAGSADRHKVAQRCAAWTSPTGRRCCSPMDGSARRKRPAQGRQDLHRAISERHAGAGVSGLDRRPVNPSWPKTS